MLDLDTNSKTEIYSRCGSQEVSLPLFTLRCHFFLLYQIFLVFYNPSLSPKFGPIAGLNRKTDLAELLSLLSNKDAKVFLTFLCVTDVVGNPSI
jgi:hypothetical protein